MKFARWQNSCAMTFSRRSSSSITFSASSMAAWWRNVGPEGSEGFVDFERMVSRFQFARPAVVLSFLLQSILTPPVEAASSAIFPSVIFSSSSLRKDSVRSCLVWEKVFLASLVRRSGFMGDFRGEKRTFPSTSVRGLRVGLGVFRGEYSSFQSLTTSWDQNASELCRWGDVGIRGSLAGDGRMRGWSLGLPGGVVNRVSFVTFRLFSDGELETC